MPTGAPTDETRITCWREGDTSRIVPLVTARDRARLATFRRRRALLRSDVYHQTRANITALTSALEHGTSQRPAPRPHRTFVRAVTWNIQRGIRLDGILETLREAPALCDVDLVLLNEVDLGLARSDNRHVAAAIADALGFEYVFGSSYLCLDHGDPRDGRPEGDHAVGLHGNAILSRYPLRRAENVPLHVTRDKLQSSERRLGCKKALWAEVDHPTGPLLVAAAHLDSITAPSNRAAQLTDLLATIPPGHENPLLLGGDLNTTTYDVSSLPALLWNISVKMLRGGFAHGIHHYMHPWERYDRPVFDVLAVHGLEWRSLNDLSRGTLRYEVGSFDSESTVTEHLPASALAILRWGLRPWNGVAPLRMDWFCGRGLRALATGERVDPDGRQSQSPTTVERPRWNGQPISDHDPVVVDVCRQG